MAPWSSPTNVFVLGTGRCGTVTFSKACENLTNFTVGHETLAGEHGAARFDFPRNHIEADNRLTWFLPQLHNSMQGRKVHYVHLRRDPEATAQSFLKRFGRGIMSAFGNGMLMHPGAWPPEEHADICRFYVETVTENITHFLRDKPHDVIHLEEMDKQFPRFLKKIRAQGDLEAAVAEWSVAHNAS